MSWIVAKRGVVVACDVASLDELERLVKGTLPVAGIVSYKVGAALAIRHGLRAVVELIRSLSSIPVIYDHQKAGTDIPESADGFARACAESGVDAVILFPQSGPRTLAAYVTASRNRGLVPIVGGHMTHQSYLQSSGGFLIDSAPAAIYHEAAKLGVSEFVVPGNQPKVVAEYRALLSAAVKNEGYWFPGIGRQGGAVKDILAVVGEARAYAIVGSSIYGASNPREAAARIVSDFVGTEEVSDGKR